ncbi:MAG: HD family hydrolase [Candidatus Thorarchaeota archaeon]
MNAENIIETFIHATSTKRMLRTGWSIAGVRLGRDESVAEHTWGTTFLTLLISKSLISSGEKLDLEKALAMAIIHDLAESKISDVPLTATELGGDQFRIGKRNAELAALKAIFSRLNEFRQESVSLLQEFSESVSLESKIVQGSDVLDMLFHAILLERNGVKPSILAQFFRSGQDKLNSLNLPLANEIFDFLSAEHEANLKRL